MKILFYGAGVIGSIYGARLCRAGHDVSVLARGQRFRDIRERGIVLQRALTGEQAVVRVNVVEQLAPDDVYDLIVVALRKNQVDTVLPILAANRRTQNIMFMVNNPLGYDEWINAVGRERLLLAFPGCGGTIKDNIVRYIIVSGLIQPTTFGEPDGRQSARLREIVAVFKSAGFPVAISNNMDAWQKSHVAWVSPVANAIYMAGGDNYKLARTPELVRLMVRAIRESYLVLRTLKIPVTPPKLRFWELIPEFILVTALRWWANTKHFETAATHHSNAARDEMETLAAEFRTLVQRAAVQTPALDEMYKFLRATSADGFLSGSVKSANEGNNLCEPLPKQSRGEL